MTALARPGILVVDDEPHNLELLVRALRQDFTVFTASSGAEALDVLSSADVDVIVSDQRMPGMSGTELLREAARRQPTAKRLLLTAYADSDALLDAINGGIHHFLRKPWKPDELRATIGEFARLRRLEHENQALLESLNVVTRKLAQNERLLERDLDERGKELLATVEKLTRLNEDLKRLAYTDGLTGLYNHRCFQQRLREELAQAKRYGYPCSLVMLDIDNFKSHNDRWGHSSGDDVLRSIGRLLLGQLPGGYTARESDIAARYGGEEFVLVLPHTDKQGAVVKGERVRECIERLQFDGVSQGVTVSCGVAEFPTDTSSVDELIRFADQALYRSKYCGRNRVVAYQSDAGAWVGSAPRALRSYRSYIPDAKRWLLERGLLALLYIDVEELTNIEREYGTKVYAGVLEGLAIATMSLSQGVLERKEIVAAGDEETPSFVVFVSDPSLCEGAFESFETLCESVCAHVETVVRRDVSGLVRSSLRVSVGYAMGLHSPSASVERFVANLVREAAASARAFRQRRRVREKLALQRLIASRQLRSHYQPIVDVSTGNVMGFEALVRGPEGSDLESAGQLLETAFAADMHAQLDAAALRAALDFSHPLPDGTLLFINVLPPTLYHDPFCREELPRLVSAAGLTPDRVVLEITEQLAISSFSHFRDALATLRALGFRIALDDVGAAQANLDALSALCPNFVKVDASIVSRVAESETHREMVRSIVAIAQSFDAGCIAEGVETLAGWEALQACGVQHVQGYLLARPGRAFPAVTIPPTLR